MMENVDSLVHTVSANEFALNDAIVSSVSGCETLCSYNWLKDGSGIVVPGGPPQWNPQPLPCTLPKDAGYSLEDAKAAKLPTYPYEPAFRALATMNPSTKFDDIDIVTRRNSLRKLLDFAAGKAIDPFRMDLHMVNDTLFISRKEASAAFMIHGAHNSGHGHNFETRFTKPGNGLNQSHSHHRVVRYLLGHLNCVVQFEVDAYYDDDDGRHSGPSQPQDPVEDAVASMANLSTRHARGSAFLAGAINVIHEGDLVDPAKLAELKLYGKNRRDPMPQIWFSRTPYLIEGRHVEGEVRSIRCTHVEAQFGTWEKDHQQALRKLVSLLDLLKSIVSGTENRSAILLCTDKGAPLTVFAAKNLGAVLPNDMTEMFWTVKDGVI
ncbi:uncharacterized protein CC84DRAFT_67352 [Paraphaeosphaeria sporulosa]|uniref:Geranylgeranyl pyrophosphate synthetase n=1 Tax=Paraphaeosphaeria sporulosa TaxID=1460663 RepID=A0A177CX55_9PLEO|nr:uncharacterized protein CC84DRAFT_67352 [Paraphaeosphaeria sporulosa]OAG12103.1 hypothetical protein CC84DRAFT_67352 [Paraphaeosphaeria sporulosa]